MNVIGWPCVQWTIYKSELAMIPGTLNLLSGKSLQQDHLFFELDTLDSFEYGNSAGHQYNCKSRASCQLLAAKIEEWTPLPQHHDQSRVHEALRKSDRTS